MLNLRRLEHLIALAEERHFARAADRVNLSQPAFSRSIQTLERDLGLRLFDRDAVEVRTTPAGDAFIARARGLLLDARALERDTRLYRDASLGDTAFGVGPFPAAVLLAPVLAAIRERHPGVCTRVEVSNWSLLLERLRREDIEFFVADARDMPPDATLAVEPLATLPGGFLVRAGHPLAGRPCRLAEVWQHGVAVTRLPEDVLGALGRLLGLLPGQTPPLALQCDEFHPLRAVALGTDTVLGAVYAAVQDDVRAGTLRPLTIVDLPPLGARTGIVRLARRSPSPLARHAMQLFRDGAARLGTAA